MGGLDPARAQEHLVTVAPATVGHIKRQLQLTGTVVAPRAARISTDIGGLVSDVVVDIGDRVARGDTLVRLDARLEELSLQQTRAATREAQARLAEAQRLFSMAQQLVKDGTISTSTLETRQSEANMAKAAADRLQAEEAAQRERVRRHGIVAPFAGVIARKSTEIGEWVAPGAVLVELVDTDRLRVDVSAPQEHFGSLQQGVTAFLEFDALPGQKIEARVAASVPVSDPTMRTFVMRLEPTADGLVLAPGMSARATLSVTTAERGVIIPRDAVKRYPDGRTTVWIAEANGETKKAVERQVTLGDAFDGRIHIHHGVAVGDTVIVQGNELLRPDQQVRITRNEG